jgi:Cu-Zn family superoxide dismutase
MVRENGLAPGWHGAHFHQVGDCSDVGVFEKSQGHVHKLEGKHGFLNPGGPEDGDLPNLFATDAGSVAAEFYTGLVTMSDLNDADGTALVIHAAEDDHTTQPIGGARDRVACAVVPGQALGRASQG